MMRNKNKLNIYPKRKNNLLEYYLLLVLVCFVWGGTPASGRTLVQQVLVWPQKLIT